MIASLLIFISPYFSLLCVHVVMYVHTHIQKYAKLSQHLAIRHLVTNPHHTPTSNQNVYFHLML